MGLPGVSKPSVVVRGYVYICTMIALLEIVTT